MALNPFREALGQAGLRAFHHESSFKSEADAALARYQMLRDDLERQIKRGDLTVKVAREKTEAAAAQLKAALKRQAECYTSVPRVFLERLIEAANNRNRAREHMSAEALQRETNRLLRATLVEQQLQTRAREFEGKTYVRMLPGGQPAPTIDSLLAYHETAVHAGDEAAMEWTRRQLESIRGRVVDPADQRRMDHACDRPEAVNPRIVASYMEAIDGSDPSVMEMFVENALETRDANACVASFLEARSAPGGTSLRWVREVLAGLNQFPDAALATLRALEAEARGSDVKSAQAQADYAIAVAEAQVRFTDVEPPTEDDLVRQSRVRAKPVARLGEPIGLALDRRGADADDVEATLACDGEE